MLVSALRPAAALAWTPTCSSAWRAFSEYSKGNHSHDSTETIDFGFQQVPREQKQELVGQVFSSVAQSYDLMNDLMSGGIHRLWKDRLVESLNPAPHLQHIDVAGGTGDVAFRVVRAMRAAAAAASSSSPAAQQHPQQPPGLHQQPPPPPQQHTQQQEDSPSISSQQEKQQQQQQQESSQQQSGSSQAASSDPRDSGGWVTVCDINPDMLAVGQQRAAQQGLDARMSFVEGNAEALPFPDASFDSYTIAFGIRNVTDRPAALRDAWRVLRRGGRFMCLEFSQVQVPLMREVYDAYSLHVIPAIGGLVARDAASYQYLVESIRQFPDQDTFAGMLRDAGFKAVSYENLTGGIVAIHSGFKL